MKKTEVNIEWKTDNNECYHAYYLDFIKENTRSIYAEGMYGNIYRVEKTTNRLYIDGKFNGIVTKCTSY